jgi:A/G-specific adenine glycosylase
MSEMMLRRTRAEQVVPIYKAATKRYPTAPALAAADPDELRALLQPLGLSWRAENIVTMAREVQEQYGGQVPSHREELMNLTGVGPYVASAVACFSSNKPVAIIDTNVVRVIGRVFGLRLDGEARRRKEMIEAVHTCLDRHQARLYNYSLLDFAAAICTAHDPRCGDCPFGRRNFCEYARALKQPAPSGQRLGGTVRPRRRSR